MRWWSTSKCTSYPDIVLAPSTLPLCLLKYTLIQNVSSSLLYCRYFCGLIAINTSFGCFGSSLSPTMLVELLLDDDEDWSWINIVGNESSLSSFSTEKHLFVNSSPYTSFQALRNGLSNFLLKYVSLCYDERKVSYIKKIIACNLPVVPESTIAPLPLSTFFSSISIAT